MPRKIRHAEATPHGLRRISNTVEITAHPPDTRTFYGPNSNTAVDDKSTKDIETHTLYRFIFSDHWHDIQSNDVYLTLQLIAPIASSPRVVQLVSTIDTYS